MPEVHLVVIRPDGGREEHRASLPVVLGRDPATADVAIADRMVSRRHARLEAEGHRVVLVDLDSANGTWVGDEAVDRHPLRADDTVVLGESHVRWAFAERPTNRAREVVEGAHDELGGFLSFEHGFLPREPPLTALPASHRAWDELADRIPALFTRLETRPVVDRLPLLDADVAALPDRFLFRASTLLGILAHAYWYAEIDPPAALPEAVERPWRQVSERLGKPVPSVSYVDLFLYNWRLRDPAGPRRLANLDLLVPTWGNDAERIFYLVTTEFAMELAPVLGAMVRAQEAAVAADLAALRTELTAILATFRHLTRTIYPQIDPNPASLTHCNQVLWAKTVGIAGVPILDGAPSPAGTAQPQFHAMDAFFGRGAYATTVGQQSLELRAGFPRHWTAVVEALAEVSVADVVAGSGDGDLAGLWDAVLDAYAGDHGWMGLHRVKAYGFLEVAFTVGRAVTTGARFTGLFRDKTWEVIDAELAEVRDERWPATGRPTVRGRVLPGRALTPGGTAVIDIDVAGQGVQYEPGDRLGVLAENDDDLVRRTLAALRATGDEIVALTADWRAAVAARGGGAVEVLPLRAVLVQGRIRPMTRGVAKRLVALSANGPLRRIVDARMEDQWELDDVLGLLASGGFDVTRLWRAAPDSPESLCRVVPPEVHRLYSLASAPDGSDRLRLVVGKLSYATERTTWSYPRERHGSASSFLHRMTEPRYRHKDLALTVVPTPRFRLPDDGSVPVVMVAAGSGIAPFLGFCAARAADPAPGPTTLLLGVRSATDLVALPDLDRWVRAGVLTLEVAFSRADEALEFDGTGHVVVPGRARRLDDLLAERSALLAGIAERGHLYVCGRADVAATVMATVGRAAGTDTVRRLIAEGRYAQDVFTTYGGHARARAPIDVSTLVEHTRPDSSWTAISGTVYDVTEFAAQHVGGVEILRAHVGTDATGAYRGVLHHERPEVDSMLGMYELGPMRRLSFGSAWAVVLGPDGLRPLALEQLFTAWVRALYLVVEMDNALVNDYGFAAGTVPTPYVAQFLAETHRRFRVSYLDGLLDDEVATLAELTTAFCALDRPLGWFAAGVADLRDGPDHRAALDAMGALRAGIRSTRAAAMCRFVEQDDRRLLAALRAALRDGVIAFETHEATVVEHAGEVLLAALAQVLAAVTEYDRRVATHARATGFTGAPPPPPPAPDRGVPGHGAPLVP